MDLLTGKEVANKIKENILKDMEILKEKKKVLPHLALFSMGKDEASLVYVRKIEQNCKKYGINISIFFAKTEEEFITRFFEVKEDDKYTSIMFAEPLTKKCKDLINEIPKAKDVEGVTDANMGNLFLNGENNMTPCTSRAVIEILEYYNINLKGKKVIIVGRSNIVGKPLIPQLLKRDATVTICHSKTENLDRELQVADVIIMAIGKPNFLKEDMIKKDSILIDVGINVVDNKIVGDIDFESVKNKAKAITPVPGGIGIVTNALLINNIVNSVK